MKNDERRFGNFQLWKHTQSVRTIGTTLSKYSGSDGGAIRIRAVDGYPRHGDVQLTAYITAHHGSANGSELARTRSSEIITVGAAIAIFIIVSLLGGQAASIGVTRGRVVGSWIAAIGILMLGWSLRVTS
jgi:hypothetical protein